MRKNERGLIVIIIVIHELIIYLFLNKWLIKLVGKTKIIEKTTIIKVDVII